MGPVSDDPLADLPRAYGEPVGRGHIRVEPEDFRVEELLGFEPDGAGGHGLLTVEKRGANTGWVAARLAAHAGVAVRDVGFSGQKDRHALTRQAFTVPLAHGVEVGRCLDWQGEGYAVVAAARHGRKLRPGSHRANRFEVRVREFHGERAAVERRLERVATEGVPNYFGAQRFGNDGANLARAREWAESRRAPRDRAQRGFALSAARSFLFNTVLAARVGRGDWNRLLPGEAVMLEGRRSFFVATEVDATLEQRCAEFDVHPSGPLPGRGEAPSGDLALEVEHEALAPHAALVEWLAREGLEHERRSLRLAVRELDGRLEADDALVLRFTLPRGTFATAVLHELLA